jgi:TrmH family RNA methyltransferase
LQILTLGKHNQKLADLRKAIDSETLTPDGLLPVEGPKLIQEAFRSGIVITEVFARRGFPVASLSLPSTTCVYELEPSVFKTIQRTETSQGIIALVRPGAHTLDEVLQSTNPLIVVLSHLQDPGNAGTILRVSEAFNASGCIATIGTVSAYNAKVVRASAGSIFRLPCVWQVEHREVFSAIRRAGVAILGASPVGHEPIDAWDWNKPSAVVIGNEGGGLSEEDRQSCDNIMRIPMNPAVESLNSAVAAAVVLYEAFRQRNL